MTNDDCHMGAKRQIFLDKIRLHAKIQLAKNYHFHSTVVQIAPMTMMTYKNFRF
jgi:hypothetical protein